MLCLLGLNAQNILRVLARALSKKWSRPYSAVMGYVRARISLAIVRGSHLCLRGSRVPVPPMSYACPSDADPAGFYCLHTL